MIFVQRINRKFKNLEMNHSIFSSKMKNLDFNFEDITDMMNTNHIYSPRRA